MDNPQNDTVGENEEGQFHRYYFPLVILDSFGDVVSHNLQFAKINLTPHDCLQLRDFEKIEKKGIVYLVRIKKFLRNKEEYFLYLFSTLEHLKFGLSSEEKEILEKNENQDLEIATSSMAHELNNPVAGILGSLELIEMDLNDFKNDKNLVLDINWDDILKDVLEIKKSAKRGKDLIDIFLGFSSRKILEQKELTGNEIKEIFQNSLKKSLELLRPRMLEANIHIEVSLASLLVKDQTFFLKKVPTLASFTLLFYFLFNDSLLFISHQRLVLQTPLNFKLQFNWKIILNSKFEGPDCSFLLTVFHEGDKDVFHRCLQSRLFQYLLKMIKLEVLSNHSKENGIKYILWGN